MSKSTVPCWYCTGLCYMVVLARRVSQPSQRHCSICFHGCAEKPADSHGHDGAEFAYVQQRLTYRCTAHAKQPRAHAMMLFHAAQMQHDVSKNRPASYTEECAEPNFNWLRSIDRSGRKPSKSLSARPKGCLSGLAVRDWSVQVQELLQAEAVSLLLLNKAPTSKCVRAVSLVEISTVGCACGAKLLSCLREVVLRVSSTVRVSVSA